MTARRSITWAGGSRGFPDHHSSLGLQSNITITVFSFCTKAELFVLLLLWPQLLPERLVLLSRPLLYNRGETTSGSSSRAGILDTGAAVSEMNTFMINYFHSLLCAICHVMYGLSTSNLGRFPRIYCLQIVGPRHRRWVKKNSMAYLMHKFFFQLI